MEQIQNQKLGNSSLWRKRMRIFECCRWRSEQTEPVWQREDGQEMKTIWPWKEGRREPFSTGYRKATHCTEHLLFSHCVQGNRTYIFLKMNSFASKKYLALSSTSPCKREKNTRDTECLLLLWSKHTIIYLSLPVPRNIWGYWGYLLRALWQILQGI